MKVNLWQYKLAELKNKTKYEMFHDIHKGDTIKREEAKFFEEMRQEDG